MKDLEWLNNEALCIFDVISQIEELSLEIDKCATCRLSLNKNSNCVDGIRRILVSTDLINRMEAFVDLADINVAQAYNNDTPDPEDNE